MVARGLNICHVLNNFKCSSDLYLHHRFELSRPVSLLTVVHFRVQSGTFRHRMSLPIIMPDLSQSFISLWNMGQASGHLGYSLVKQYTDAFSSGFRKNSSDGRNSRLVKVVEISRSVRDCCRRYTTSYSFLTALPRQQANTMPTIWSRATMIATTPIHCRLVRMASSRRGIHPSWYAN